MPARKKALSKKAAPTKMKSDRCEVCGCCCKGEGAVELSMVIIFGGLVVALSFFLLQTMV